MADDLTMEETPEVNRLAERLGRLQHLRKRCGVYGQPASQADIRALRAMLAEAIDTDVAREEVALAVQDASPNSIWSLYSQDGLKGGVAFLPLNALGVYKLIYGKLDPTNPGLEAVAVRNERPTVLYVWGLISRGRGLVGLSDVLHNLGTQRFRNVDIWTCPVTEKGERLAQSLGLERVAHGERTFYKLDRSTT
jgi:hypothetical protein